jgi:hypothetical protein
MNIKNLINKETFCIITKFLNNKIHVNCVFHIAYIYIYDSKLTEENYKMSKILIEFLRGKD